jgi:UDP-N-acetylglucosamine 1-carboxyvinyltransferase
MDAFVIKGGSPLRGTVEVSGAKNASLPIVAAALLAPGESVLLGAPKLADVTTLGLVLKHMGATVRHDDADGSLHLDTSNLHSHEAPYELVRTMRASILVLGPLLARYGHARVSLPGGCAIGARPVDQHLKGLEALGATISISHGYIEAQAPKGGLTPGHVHFDVATVTGTENLMLAAALLNGTTVLHGAAKEPEIEDLAYVLMQMGADVEGAGTETITVHGNPQLKPFRHRVLADRIEAGTLLVAGALMGEPLTVKGCILDHQERLLHCLEEMGAQFTRNGDSVTIRRMERPKPIDVRTAPYPGFPTDMQAQLMTLMAVGQGVSTITETIWENRYMHVAELDRLGAHIRVDGRTARITGVEKLSGSTVMATDLRASACLVLAGLVAEGETHVRRVYHLDRGYEALERKLAAVGADIKRVREP